MPNKESIKGSITGELTDEIIDLKTNEKKTRKGHNQITIGCHRLICSLISNLGMPAKTGDENVQALNADDLYFAIGCGTTEANSSDEGLSNPLFKVKINGDDSGSISVDTVNNIVEVSYFFDSVIPSNAEPVNGEGTVDDTSYNNREWTECAIYKGNFMINRKVHSAISKTGDIALKRTFRFEF